MEPLAGCSVPAGFALGARGRPLRDALAGARRGAPAGPRGRLADGGRGRGRRARARAAAVRFGGDPLAVVIFGAWFVTLVIGLATDLDQRLLPDVLTLPVIPVALVYALSGTNPLVGTQVLLAVVAALAIPAVLYLPSIPFGAGAFGLGDVKLLVGVGLLAGGEPGARERGLRARPGRCRPRSSCSPRAGSGASRTSRSGRSSSSARCGRTAAIRA